MNYDEVLNAKANLNGTWQSLPVCNGKAVPRSARNGGKGTGEAFTANVDALRKYKLNMRVLHKL